MKIIRLFFCLLISCLLLAEVQAKKPTPSKIKFEKTIYDLGKVKRADALKWFPVKYTNTGKHDLLITTVKVGCGCTKVQFDQSPLKPGQSSFISVLIDLRQDFHTDVTKSIIVCSDTKTPDVEIFIKMHLLD